MKALFARNRKNEYPDHHYPEQAPTYYPPKNSARNGDSNSGFTAIDYRSAQQDRATRHAAQSGLTTLEALQIIRRRFEENQKITYEDQAA